MRVFSVQYSVFSFLSSVVVDQWSVGRGRDRFGFRISDFFRHSSFVIRHSLALLIFASLQAGAAIPDRPEKLTFPPLTYEPPAPEKFRVSLKSGAVAYVVPDH